MTQKWVLRANNPGISNRGDMADQASLALERDIQVGVAAVISRGDDEGVVQIKTKDGKVLCVDCSKEISEARLKATERRAVRCTECKSKLEEDGGSSAPIGFVGGRRRAQ